MAADRTFIHTNVFDRQWEALGCDDDDLARLQRAICDDPQGAPVIRGTGGVRKIRVVLDGRGKSGGARVLYADLPGYGVAYLLSVYAKNEKEDITDAERQSLKTLMTQIALAWRKRK
jgi:hypothetical protein